MNITREQFKKLAKKNLIALQGYDVNETIEIFGAGKLYDEIVESGNVGAVIGSTFRSTLIELGFKELPHSTITASLTYDLGRHRQLSFGSIQTPNEMLYIYEVDDKDPRNITDLVCLRNFDYDGYTSVEQIKELITFLTGRVF